MRGYIHWCEGCNLAHRIVVSRSGPGPVWDFNQSVDNPTFHPHVRVCAGVFGNGKYKYCRYVIRSGQIIYHSESHHALKGKTVPLPIFPATYLDDDELRHVVAWRH